MTDAVHRVDITVEVNGSSRSATVDVRRTLVELLREDLALTGTHVGCEHGVCGSCTVLVDGVSARACLTLAARVDGRAVVTIEGLAGEAGLSVLQQACLAQHSFQCGFCTPGILAVATELLAEVSDPARSADLTDATVREAIAGNLCRCTGYEAIVAGILQAAAVMRGDAEPEQAAS